MNRLKTSDWFERGLFTYPPMAYWREAAVEDVREAWRCVVRERTSPLGLYIQLPAELACVPQPEFPVAHPYLRCLRHEAELLEAPDGRFENAYIGGGSRGALSVLGTKTIEELLNWLHERFELDSLRQFTAEIDATEMIEEKAALLKRHGVDRVTASLPHLEFHAREAFARGVCLCREAGIGAVDVDLKGPWKDPAALRADADFAAALEPDSMNLPFGLSPQRTDGPSVRNLQLCQMRELRGAVLGLGWGAAAYAGRRMLYAKAESYLSYIRDSLDGAELRCIGGPVSPDRAMRGRLIAGLGENGYVDRAVFSEAFGMNPEEAFPDIFARLLRDKRLIQEGDRFGIAPADKESRLACAAAFCEEEFMLPDGEEERCAPAPVEAPKELLDAAIAAFSSGNLAEALRGLDDCLTSAPRDINALMTRSVVHMEMNNPEASRSDLDAAVGILEGRLEAGREPWESEASFPVRRALADALSSRGGPNDAAAALLVAPADWPHARRCAELAARAALRNPPR